MSLKNPTKIVKQSVWETLRLGILKLILQMPVVIVCNKFLYC